MSAGTSADELRRIVLSGFESGMNHDRQAAALDELVERASRSTPREPSPPAIADASYDVRDTYKARAERWLKAEAALPCARSVEPPPTDADVSPENR